MSVAFAGAGRAEAQLACQEEGSAAVGLGPRSTHHSLSPGLWGPVAGEAMAS